MTGRSLFVTGATSGLGKEVCRLASERGAAVTALTRDRVRAGGLPAGVTLLEGTCEDPRGYRDALRRCTLVVHAAGMRHTSSIIRACSGHDALERIAFISSTRIHFPDRLLSRAELEGKRVLLEAEANVASTWLPWTILRPTLIHSPQDRSINRFVTRIAHGRVFPVPGSGNVIRQPISAVDLADSVLRALDSPETHRKSYDVPGREITLIDMLNTIQRLLGKEVRMVPVPKFAPAALKVLGRMWVDDRLSAACTRYLRWYEDIESDGSDAARDFGHAPRDFMVAMREQIDSSGRNERGRA